MIELNSFSALTVHGLVLKDGQPISQTFQRGVSRQGQTCAFKVKSYIKCDDLPPRPPSNLPPPGNKHLSITLGKVVGSGRIGTIRQVNLLSHDIELPSLVAKISRFKRSALMEQEAWFYEELEQVQGIAVPRCYGFFQAQIREGTVSTWGVDDSDDDSESDGSIESCGSGSGSETDESSPPNNTGEPMISSTAVECIPVLPVPDPTLLSILLLERMGARMPVGKPLNDIESDVYEIYDDLGMLGIEHLDIRWSNILKVLPNQGSSGIVCPNHGRVHQWRAIDFDLARKTNSSRAYMETCSSCWLRRLFDNLPNGIVVEPGE